MVLACQRPVGRVDDGVHVAVVPADSIDGALLTVEVAGGGPNAGLVVEGSLLASIEEHAGDLGLGGISLDEDILGEVVAHDVVDLIILITVYLVEAGNRLEGIRLAVVSSPERIRYTVLELATRPLVIWVSL